MTALKYLVATAVLTVPVLFVGAPAEAITARQTALQGQGLYTTSKGVPEGYGRSYGHRGWYRYRAWHHRRFY